MKDKCHVHQSDDQQLTEATDILAYKIKVLLILRKISTATSFHQYYCHQREFLSIPLLKLYPLSQDPFHLSLVEKGTMYIYTTCNHKNAYFLIFASEFYFPYEIISPTNTSLGFTSDFLKGNNSCPSEKHIKLNNLVYQH